MTNEMRRCRNCGDTFPIEMFYPNGVTTTGKPRFRSACRYCEQGRSKSNRKPTAILSLRCTCGDISKVLLMNRVKADGYHGYMCSSCYKSYMEKKNGNDRS